VNVDEADVLAASSYFSFLDINDNGNRDSDEPAGPLPVMAATTLGGGQVMLIADPSLFINGMSKMADNGKFIRNIAEASSGGLYIDQAHLAQSELQSTKNLLRNVRNFLTNPLATFGLIILVLIIAMFPVWYRKGKKTTEA
jgi:hypothetical protein